MARKDTTLLNLNEPKIENRSTPSGLVPNITSNTPVLKIIPESKSEFFDIPIKGKTVSKKPK
jgi:hypothetical protein